jgi:hypothetical protein
MASRTKRHYPYDNQWRRHICPRVLKEAGGRVDKRGRYSGGAKCAKCKAIEPALAAGERRRFEVAHLDGNCWNRQWWNLACLCRPCHRSHDYPTWARRYRATMRAKAMRKNDAKRELLALMTAPAQQLSLLEAS